MSLLGRVHLTKGLPAQSSTTLGHKMSSWGISDQRSDKNVNLTQCLTYGGSIWLSAKGHLKIWTHFAYYRWVRLKPDFLGAWKSVRLKHYPAYPIIIISLIIQRNLATKIRPKRESGLTAVRLKRDPPVWGLFYERPITPRLTTWPTEETSANSLAYPGQHWNCNIWVKI